MAAQNIYGQPQQINPLAVVQQLAQIQGGFQNNALARMQAEGMQQDRALKQQQLRNALALEQTRGRYFDAIDPSKGPAMPMTPANALAAGLKPEEIKALMPPEQKLHNLGPGGRLVDGGGKVVAEAPFKPEQAPELVRLMDAMNAMPANDPRRAVLQDAIRKQTTHAPGVSVSYGAPVAGQDAAGNPVFFQPSKDGRTPPAIVSGVQPPSKAENLTEGQAKAVQFASRMQAADNVMAELAQKGAEVSLPGSMKNNIVGDVMTAMSSPEGQKLNQAKRDFVNAVLRRESGAVISPEEFANADRQYFPQIGDSKAVIQQKAENRRRAIEGMRADVPRNRQSEVDRIAAPSGGPKRIKTDAEYNALPSGATFIAPDGTTRRKP